MKQQRGTKEVDYEKRLKCLSQKIAKNPNDVDSIFDKGALLMEMGRLTEAEEIFRYMYIDDPKNLGALSYLIEALILEGETEEAYKLCDRLFAEDTEYARNVYFSLILALHAYKKKPGEAITIVDRAIDTEFDLKKSYLFKAVLLLDTGQTAQAEYYINLAIKNHWDNLNDLLLTAVGIGEYHPAIALKLYLEIKKANLEKEGEKGVEKYGLPIDGLIANAAYEIEDYETYLKHLGPLCETEAEFVKQLFGDRMGRLTPKEFYAKEQRELGNK